MEKCLMGKDVISKINGVDDSHVEILGQLSNPLKSKSNISNNAISNYSQTVSRPKYDEDIIKVVEVVRILNNLAPLTMPEYCFDANQINGDCYYKPDGTPLLIREFDSDIIRDYYYNPNSKNPNINISRILEHDKNTGRLRVKIEPIIRIGSRLKASIAIFDEKINNKYTIMQLSEGGIVSNISEFSGKGKSFQTLYRDSNTYRPVRYIEGKEDIENGFTMIDCIFDEHGNLARVRKYSNKKEVNINYTSTQKHISVKTR